MSLYERMERELLSARRERDSVALDTLGLLKSEVVVASKEPGQKGAIDDELVMRMAQKEVRRREEAVAAYRGAGRTEQAEREEKEATILRTYLPAQLSDAELEVGVQAIVAETGASGPQAFGIVMKEATSRFRGQADGARIAALARRLLGGQ